MWDTVVESSVHLSHEMPCPWCRHASHRFLPCSDRCECAGWSPWTEPGTEPAPVLTGRT